MENEAERFEYVLNDTGRIWMGSARCNSGKPWNFGQVTSTDSVNITYNFIEEVFRDKLTENNNFQNN